MPQGFRWKDDNISEDEYTRRRKIIRDLLKFHETLLCERRELVQKSESELSQQWNVFGDTDETVRDNTALLRGKIAAFTDVELNFRIALFNIFGQHEVEHAVDEAQERIGTLPYVKE